MLLRASPEPHLRANSCAPGTHRPDGRRRRESAIETGAVVALTHEGDGIVREGKAAFVAGALPGELIRFRRAAGTAITMRGAARGARELAGARDAALRALWRVRRLRAAASVRRRADRGQGAANCATTLERVAQASPRTLARRRSPVPQWGYRRRARLSARYVAKKGRVLVGFRERFKPYVSAIRSCEVLAPVARR